MVDYPATRLVADWLRGRLVSRGFRLVRETKLRAYGTTSYVWSCGKGGANFGGYERTKGELRMVLWRLNLHDGNLSFLLSVLSRLKREPSRTSS